jgi:Tol biopolymer transport system component
MRQLRFQLAAASLALVPLLALPPTTTSARVVPVRTLLISDPPGAARTDGRSANPQLARDGRMVVFDSTATNFIPYDINGSIRDVVTFNLANGQYFLISAGGDGPSAQPAVSADGRYIAFTSLASTFAPRDTNRVADVYIRDSTGPITLVSAAQDGSAGNGPSGEADISADGRFVVFTSAASNLVPGDGNGKPDVFLRDTRERKTVRLSVSSREVEGNGASGAPAISANGRVVSFASVASNLVRGDTNGVSDVFARVVSRGVTERVSVSTSGRQQNKAVAAPFNQISDLTRSGRHVVFDSDATNLVRRDANRRTDVFHHDRRTGRTRLVSASSVNRQGDNDSFNPTITPSGRHIAFQSFAGNLAPGDVRGEDLFIRDLRLETTSVVNVPARGGLRAPELVKQQLVRPALSERGTRVTFSSTVPNLVPADSNGLEDVFIRLLEPPKGRIVTGPTVVLDADDPAATSFVCTIDARTPFLCPRGPFRAPKGLRAGRHVLRVRAGGPGMLFDRVALRARIVTGRS